ncbi:MAG: hypothetical protein H0T62_10885 [Parachlamydiaceae bacterium]|nr:hypothetical protein [Parachlamydiaceae bacterium]
MPRYTLNFSNEGLNVDPFNLDGDDLDKLYIRKNVDKKTHVIKIIVSSTNWPKFMANTHWIGHLLSNDIFKSGQDALNEIHENEHLFRYLKSQTPQSKKTNEVIMDIPTFKHPHSEVSMENTSPEDIKMMPKTEDQKKDTPE